MLTDRQTSHANSLGLFTERVPKGNGACLQAFENEPLRTTLLRCDLASSPKQAPPPLMRSRREARASWVRSEVQICSIPNRHNRIWSENEILLLHLTLWLQNTDLGLTEERETVKLRSMWREFS